jgi:uncharacterized membrane protein
MEYFIFYVMICLLVAIMGRGKTIGYWGVFLWSMLLTPVIGFFIGLFCKSQYRANLEHQAYTNMANQNFSKVNVSEELDRLQQLKDKGTITEEEFTRLKNDLIK